MALTTEERSSLEKHARDAMTTIEELFFTYVRKASAPAATVS